MDFERTAARELPYEGRGNRLGIGASVGGHNHFRTDERAQVDRGARQRVGHGYRIPQYLARDLASPRQVDRFEAEMKQHRTRSRLGQRPPDVYPGRPFGRIIQGTGNGRIAAIQVHRKDNGPFADQIAAGPIGFDFQSSILNRCIFVVSPEAFWVGVGAGIREFPGPTAFLHDYGDAEHTRRAVHVYGIDLDRIRAFFFGRVGKGDGSTEG